MNAKAEALNQKAFKSFDLKAFAERKGQLSDLFAEDLSEICKYNSEIIGILFIISLKPNYCRSTFLLPGI
jgi:hypothetical protein